MSLTNDDHSPRTPSSTSRRYHVFLSFRGEDVRRTFVDHLYASLQDAGVNAFLDSHDIKRGDEICSTINKAIDNSDILIPIFSKNFAESHWCLEEVARMCKANGKIVPLFYDVKPTEARNPWRGAFAKAFEEKLQRYTPERISEWESALHNVCSFSGWCPEDISGFEAQLVKLIVQDVFKILDQNATPLEEALPRSLEEDPSDTIPQEIRNEPLRISKTILMGMEEHKSKVIKMLNTDSDENVLTVAIYGNGGVGKTSLAKAIHNHIYLKFDATCIVYDVRHKAQNTNGVAKMQRQILKDLVKFKDKVNDEVHGKMLMKGHLRSIKALVILEYVDDWKQLEALRGNWFGPGSRVLVTMLDPNILMSENGSFAYELQGLAMEHALQLFSWHAFMRDQPEEDYKELSYKAVDICKRLPFSLEVLGAHLYNRDLSHWKQAIQTLENSHGKNAILRLCYDGLESEEKEMFLDMACLFIGRKRESVSSFWEASHLCPNVGLTKLMLKSLIKLDEHERFVMHSELRDMGRAIVAEESQEPGKRSRLWKPEEVELVIMEGKGPKNLKVIKLNYYTSLQVLPDLANHRSLIQLELCGCKELRKLPESIEFLTKLKYLDLSNCCNLIQLPKTITKLKSLEVLFLSNCHSIRMLPDSFEHLRVLKKVKLDGMPLKKLPRSFRWLSCLEKLSLRFCYDLRSLPPIGELKHLRYLDLHGCSSLQTLPGSVYELESLCRLDLTGCKRISLGAELGDLVCMERLVLSNCGAIWSLPISIGQLNCLHHLNLNHCTSLFRLPEELGNLVRLEELLLNECYNLCELPQSIGNLSCLKILEMEETYSLSCLPPSFSRLTSLKHLKASGCPLPQRIGDFSLLEILHLKSYKMTTLPPTVGTLLRLSKLYIYHCTEFSELSHLPKELIEVHIQDCLGLKMISNMQNMKRLKLLRIHNCRELVELPDLGSLQSLQELSISECRNLKRIQGMEGLKSLRRVHVKGCRLASSGSSILKPRQLIKETHCLELLSFSANEIPECLEKMETNGDDLLYVTLDSNEQCSGIILCFVVRFKGRIGSVGVELGTLRDDKEIFNTRLVNHSKTVEGDQIFVHILRQNHPMVMMVQSGDVIRAKVDRDDERTLIRSGGIQFFFEGEDGKREDQILESLGKDLTMLMEDYSENLAFEDDE